MSDIREKEKRLAARLKELGHAAVAFSGGTDSALLLYSASRSLGSRAAAISLWSPLLSQRDRDEIISFTDKYAISLICVEFDETRDAEFCLNGSDRCYRCKSLRLQIMAAAAQERGIPWVLDGSNASDLLDYRPGMRAIGESKITLSPLLECGFTKDDIRSLSRRYKLPTAEKPAAACLASRIRTNVTIEKSFLQIIDEGEEIIRAFLPDNAQVRLRYDGKIAKIETDRENIPRLSAVFNCVKKELFARGLEETVISTDGYRMGSVTSRPK